MKVVELELTDEIYESLREDAERMRISIAELVVERIRPPYAPAVEKWSLKPLDMGGPFLFPPERWRELPDEDRAA